MLSRYARVVSVARRDSSVFCCASCSCDGHRVERLGQHAEFVARGHRLSTGEVALRHGARTLREEPERRRETLRQHDREAERGSERKEQRQGQRQRVKALQALAGEGNLLVIVRSGANRLEILGERLRHGLHDLEHLERFQLVVGVDRHDDPQLDEHALGRLFRCGGRLLQSRAPERRRGRRLRRGRRSADAGDRKHAAGR